MMRPRHLLMSVSALLLLAGQAQAEVKSYDLEILTVLNTTTLTVTGVTRETLFQRGIIEITDESNAAPTLSKYQINAEIILTTRTDVFAGPNSFIYVRQLYTLNPAAESGTGDTEGFVKWNPLSSWTATGGEFCKGSNEVGNPLGGNICVVVTTAFESTIATTVPSETYDLPLWTFDAMGDFSSDSYLWAIQSGRSSNQEYFTRGKLQIDIPAMSIVGFGVLGAGLVFLGLRTLKRRGQH